MNWQSALDKFLKDWKDKDFVEAALLTGSYAVGLQTKHSDVDVYIVLSDKVEWRERGNVIIDGVLIEYFANPVKQIRQYFKKEFKQNKRSTARIITIGKVLFDKTGIAEELKREALEYMKKPFEKPDEIWVEIAKYFLWDMLDSLKDAEERNDPSFSYLYHLTINKALEIYSKFLCVEIPPASKVYRLFTDGKFREAYMFEEFPDKEFVKLFLSAMKSLELRNLELVIEHVFDKMGGFNINGWQLRTKIEV
ncbi:nucleotidyltransferase [Thermococcus sp. M39]|uniref:nucleotidyltransferase domain-containing protein n=1 Tax=unclassified Thermococcus TaxID=2627626 RepID=UPI00143A0DB4|nr:MULTISPECIES: nucleotidyltransferase domain-containing protein [unclassified Thermococcus]NJE07958.1 nucleotidyltransferase [Thermococcus sp. M39]NJE13656.1 nucleotidyltransferase [Thermococcus sp. LS2]